jgi:hypothetical protein
MPCRASTRDPQLVMDDDHEATFNTVPGTWYVVLVDTVH